MTLSEQTSPRATGALVANLTCMASMVIWATGLPAVDPLLDLVNPVALVAVRTGLAGIVLLAFWYLIEGAGPLRRAPWRSGMVIGALTIGLGAFLMLVGQKLSDPVTVAIISTTMPIVGLTIEGMLDRRRPDLPLIVGLALSIIGGAVALDLADAKPGFGFGALLCLGSTVTFTLGSRLTVTALPGMTPTGRSAVTVTGAGIGMVLAAAAYRLISGEPSGWGSLEPWHWFALVYYAIASMALSQVLWIAAVGSLGIAVASLHANATPFYVMLILFAFGAPWNWQQTIGALIVGTGVLIAQRILWPRRL